MTRSEVDYRCYFVTGAESYPHQVVNTAVAAVRGGAGVIQVRSKPISARDLYLLAREVAESVSEANPATRVLIDDRVDVALALRNDGVPVHGVHIGQEDLGVAESRALLGPDAIIGLTTGTKRLVEDANEVSSMLDYVGCGPFRATPTKDSGRPPIGLSGYPELVTASSLPLVAIGDVTVKDAYQLATTGVAGVAIVRGIMNSEDPTSYVQQVIAEFESGRAQ